MIEVELRGIVVLGLGIGSWVGDLEDYFILELKDKCGVSLKIVVLVFLFIIF